MNPDDFRPEFDVVEQLERNLNLYEASDPCAWLSIPTLPGYLRTSLDCVRAHCRSVKTPGLSPTIVCCMKNGIRLFYADPDIDALIDLKSRLLKAAATAIDADTIDMAAEFFRRFPLGIPGTLSEPQRVNVAMPPPIKKQVQGRASELGLATAALGVLSIMVTISSQVVVHPDHAALAEDTVERFLRGVRIRRRVAEAFLEEIV